MTKPSQYISHVNNPHFCNAMHPLYTITTVTTAEYEPLVYIWTSAVKATHHFLSDEDFTFFKSKLISDFFPTVMLYCARDNNNNIVGFAGTSGSNLEMLFIHNNHRGTGIGKLLLQHAIDTLRITHLDVNEQNTQAVAFYQYLGFKIINRSSVDGMGKPYPLLHMSLV